MGNTTDNTNSTMVASKKRKYIWCKPVEGGVQYYTLVDGQWQPMKCCDNTMSFDQLKQELEQYSEELLVQKLNQLVPDGKAIVLVDIDSPTTKDEDTQAAEQGLSPVYSDSIDSSQRVMYYADNALHGVYIK